MNYCINIDNPLYRLEIAKLTKILGDSNAAIAALELNNGYSLDKAPNGKLSVLFKTINELVAKQNSQLSKEELNDKTTKLKLLVYSDNFKEWFGDWINDLNNASKVVDENGEPLIVYHVSNSLNRFKEFDREKSRNRSLWLYYFSDSLETAESYYEVTTSPIFDKELSYNDILNYYNKYYPNAISILKSFNSLDEAIQYINSELIRITGLELNRNTIFNSIKVDYNHFVNQSDLDKRLAEDYKKLFDYFIAAKNFRESDYDNQKEWLTYAVFLNIKAPFIINANGQNWDKLGHSLYKKYGIYIEDFYYKSRQNEDGLLITNYQDFRYQNNQRDSLSTTYAVENSNQIKSALENNGGFFTNSNNIYEEHQIISNGNKDLWLVSLLENSAKKEIPLKEFVESFYDKTSFKGLYDLLHQKHLTSRKHSVIEGTKIILESSLNWFSNYDKRHDLKKRFNEKRAFYDASTNELHINVDSEFTNGNADSVIWHELLHAMTVDKLQNQTNRKKFELILKDYLKSNEYNRDIYTGENGLEEFVADVWSDPDLITLLLQTKSPRKGFGYIWDQIKSWLIEAFGVSPDNSLFAEASEEIDKILNLRTFDLSNLKFYEHLNDFDQDTKDLVALMQYQYSKEGLTQDEINQRIKAFLNNDKQEVNTVKKFVDSVQIRQAQLHTLGKDFGAESYTVNGFFNWNNYLKGIDLRHDITEKDDLSAFEPITDYVIEPAEIIIPKIYKSLFKLGNYDIADIDENFFKKVNPFYDCSLKPSKSPDLSQAKIDVLVRTHTSNYNVIIKDDLSAPIEGLTRVEPRIEDGWRLSLSGKRMYQIPLDLIFEIYKDKNGVETLVIKDGEGVEKSVRKLISSTENLVSVQLFLENVKPTEDWINFAITNNNINSNNLILKQIKRRIVNNEANDDAIRGDLSMLYYDHRNKVRYKNDLASTLYNSFVKSLYLVSVRIPTQAFQSIMATKASALTNDDSNNVFVTRWQFWLQGSDLDIDKTYLMGVDISSIGTFNHWSPLADYTTRSLADISDQLPVPNGFELVLPSEYWKTTENPMVIKFDSNKDSRINTIILNYLSLDEDDNKREERLRTIVDLLNYINKNHEFAIAPDFLQDYRIKLLINLINKHNTHKVTGEEARNIIQRNILRASLDERNMKASYSPIDVVMDKFKDELKKIEDKSALDRNLNDGGLSIARAQYNNSVGKKDVGIMANGLKAFFALTHYLNKYRKDPNFVNSTRYFLTKISLGTGKDKYFSTISDIKFEESALAILENAFRTFCPELFVDAEGNPIVGPHLTFSDDDASLLISSLVSLATDNAKELALAKMNASIDLACMHLFLVVMGYSAEDVVKFTTSQAFSKVASILSKSKFDSKSLNVRDAIGLALEGVEMGTDDEYQLRLMLFIYNCAQEMSTIAKIAAINQGVKVDELDSDKFFQNVSDVISTQVDTLTDKEFGLAITPENPRRFLITDIAELIRRTHNIDNPSETLIQRYAEKLESINQRNEQYGYIDGSLKIDLLRYYRDPDYKQFIIDFYDIFKHNFNVLDCIDNLAHFNKMLEAFVLAESTILQHSSRARAVLLESRRAYQGNRVYNYLNKQESDGENTWTRRIKLFDKISFSDAIKRKASKFYDDYILSEWIKEFGQNYEITYEDEDGNIVELKLRNNQDIAKFANFIAYELIPILKEVYPKNTFLHYIKPDFKLIRKGSKELYLPRYVFNFDIDTLTTVQDQNKAFYVNNGFDELSGYTLNNVGIKTTKGGSIKLGELLYLYDRLVSSSIGQSSLDRAFDLYLSKIGKDSIASQIASIELDHDTGKRPEIHFDPLLFTAFCYSSVIRAKQNGVMVYDYDRKAKTKLELSIKEKYLFNLESIEEHKDGLLKAEEFLEAIKNGSIEASLSDGVWTLTSTVNSDIYYEFAGGNDYSIDGFIKDLIADKQTNGDAINDFINQLQELPKPSFKGYQTLQVYKTFQKNMSKIGVQVEIVNNPEIKNGYVKDGVIYLNKRSSITTTPMHELLHLVFGVMKYDNFDNYQRLMELLYTSKEILNIYSELNQSEQYQNLMDLDKKEEAFCRAIEAVINGRLQSDDLFTDGTNDFYDTVKTTLNPIIGKTFGIEAPEELINFLNDTVGNLKGYNSTLFMPVKSDSTGYLDSKAKIIQSTKISAFIEKMVKDGVLIETEC